MISHENTLRSIPIVVDPEMNNYQVDVYRDNAAFNARVKMIELHQFDSKTRNRINKH